MTNQEDKANTKASDMTLISCILKLLVILEICSSGHGFNITNVYVDMNENIELICDCFHYIQCSWSTPNLKNFNIFIYMDTKSGTYNLKITNVSALDVGSYTCTFWKAGAIPLKLHIYNLQLQPDRPEPPTNVSVIPYERYLAVSWSPEYNGGMHQAFFIEYHQEVEMWRRSGPITDNMKVRMSYILYNKRPKTRYFVRMLSKNEIGESNKTSITHVITLADRPEPPTNVSVIPYDRHLAVSWCPGYNGGEPQTFFIEYQQEVGEMWTRSGPIVDNMNVRMSYLLYNMSPQRRYFVRMFSRNEIGECNKTAVPFVMTLEPTINIYRVKAVFVVLLIIIAVILSKDVFVVGLLVLAVTLAVYGLITFFFLRRKEKDASDNYSPGEEEVRENFQGEPVDNQLYISSDDPGLARVHNLRNQSVIDTILPSIPRDNQTYQMQLHNIGGANGRRSCTYINRGVVSSVHKPQICDPSLNYSEITFNTAPTMQDAVIHGGVNRTIYSEIDLMAEPVAPLSSSESEYDENDDSDF